MAIAHAETQTGSQAAGGTSTVSASLGAGGADSLYLCWVATRSNVDVTAVAGLGLTWDILTEQCAARAQQRIEMWYAYGAGAAGAVTASHAACNASVIAVLRYTGVHSTPTDDKEGWNTLGQGGGCSGGTDNDDATGTTGFTVPTDGWIAVGVNSRNRTMNATGGWNVRVNDVAAGSGGDITTLTVEDRSASGESGPTFGAANNLSGTADWCAAICDIHPAAAAAGHPAIRRLGGRLPFRPTEVGRTRSGLFVVKKPVYVAKAA